ncbi:lipocalin family protein [Polaribacter batillariae]|uniref:Lipocalin family protein n=1 Tax=Polaribacter batillariae TaxID=2808900 RepID=A0ABX7SVQ3_9FLAO|nr:lipocalin family protein [Polaribacter batillariae]QTD38332.1 lipocalin family protein [Polaribacter batillariae]
MIKKILLVFVTTTLLLACKSNDNVDISLSNSDIVGTWNLIAFSSDASGKISSKGIDVDFTSNSVGKNFNITYTFDENPNLISAKGKFTIVTTSIANGKSTGAQEAEATAINGLGSGKWKLNKNSITFNNPDGTSNVVEVIEFSGKNMKLKASIDQDAILPTVSGADFDIKADVFITLEKQ